MPTTDPYLEIVRCDPCAYCGGTGGALDHITPRALGGADIWENLASACTSCNSEKQHRPLLVVLLQMRSRSRDRPRIPGRGLARPRGRKPPRTAWVRWWLYVRLTARYQCPDHDVFVRPGERCHCLDCLWVAPWPTYPERPPGVGARDALDYLQSQRPDLALHVRVGCG